MSYLDRIHTANAHDLRDFRVTLAPALDAGDAPADERTLAVGEVLQSLREEGVIDGWRDELYPVNRNWSERPALLIERAAVPWLGVRGYGVHMNGFVRGPDGLHMWIARRSLTKPTGPGKLDQMVAGGQPADIGLHDNVVKECAEEAGIPGDTPRGGHLLRPRDERRVPSGPDLQLRSGAARGFLPGEHGR